MDRLLVRIGPPHQSDEVELSVDSFGDAGLSVIKLEESDCRVNGEADFDSRRILVHGEIDPAFALGCVTAPALNAVRGGLMARGLRHTAARARRGDGGRGG